MTNFPPGLIEAARAINPIGLLPLNCLLDSLNHQELSANFWSNVTVSEADKCWLWGGPKRGNYGSFWVAGKSRAAHRIAFFLHAGSLDDSLLVLHSCDTPRCVNPRHLRQGDWSDNGNDCIKRDRNAAQKLDHKSAYAVRKMRMFGLHVSDVATAFGVSDTAIFRACGRQWNHVEWPKVFVSGYNPLLLNLRRLYGVWSLAAIEHIVTAARPAIAGDAS